MIDQKDLLGLIGSNTRDEENYLSNFIVDEYLEVLVAEANSQVLNADTTGWLTFEKMVGVRAANYVLKGKTPLLEQDIVLVPLNPGQSKHWSLLVADSKEKKIFVLDSLAAAYVKPCTKNGQSAMTLKRAMIRGPASVVGNAPFTIPQLTEIVGAGRAEKQEIKGDIVLARGFSSFPLHRKYLQNTWIFGLIKITQELKRLFTVVMFIVLFITYITGSHLTDPKQAKNTILTSDIDCEKHELEVVHLELQ